MKKIILTAFIFIAYSQIFSQVPDSCKLKIGTNLEGPTDYGASWPFVNIMKYARTWSTSNIYYDWENPDWNNMWDTEVIDSIPLDENGYPLELPLQINHPNCDTLQGVFAVWANTSSLQSGTYVILYDGDGDIEMNGDATITDYTPGRIEFYLNAGDGNYMDLFISRSTQGNHVRNIRVLMPGTESTYETQPFCQEWIEKLAPFKSIRFMDWGNTNTVNVQHWNDRTHVDYYTYTIEESTGVPYEWWTTLANQLDMDIWINVPHRADDNYITNMATFFKENLESNIKIYVEYSNEWWNWIFPVADYVYDSLDQNLDWPERLAPKLAEVMQIWTDVFEGEENRIVRVFASQHGWPDLSWRVMQQLATDGNTGLIDAISPTGYMGQDAEALGELDETATGLDIIEIAREETFDPEGEHMTGWHEFMQIAEDYGLQIHFYEGGQHFTPEPWGDPDVPYGQALLDAQTDPAIYGLYAQLFDTLRTLSNDEMVFEHFNLLGGYSIPYGSFGALTNQFVNPPYDEIAPKYQVLLDNIFDCTTTKGDEITDINQDEVQIFPNPSSGEINIKIYDSRIYQLKILNINGKILLHKTGIKNEKNINIPNFPAGVYFINISSNERVFTKKLIITK